MGLGGRSKKRGGAKGRGGREGNAENTASEGSSALPMANVEPLTRRVLPSNDKIAESAKQGAVEYFFSRRARPPARPAMTSLASSGEPVTLTEEELEFLRSIVPPPPGGY